ncbi:MAG: hypothetical protein KBS74_01755 [Clostridiales bacterium]|nr:hypothetical protein [Candidatus Cacconaster stercorequi]
MDEMTIKEKMVAALNEPPVPQSLVERTAVRAQALVAGREAEHRLREGDVLSDAERLYLAAQSTIGHLMMTREPPENATNRGMLQQLMENEKFRVLADCPPNRFLAELNNGTLLRKLSSQMAAKKENGVITEKTPIGLHAVRKKSNPIL